MSLSKRLKERQVFKAAVEGKSHMLPLGLSLEYIQDSPTLLSLLFLSKELRTLLKRRVYSILVSRSGNRLSVN